MVHIEHLLCKARPVHIDVVHVCAEHIEEAVRIDTLGCEDARAEQDCATGRGET